jgi:uncharacterized protein YgbK (DUF1537 family)
MIIVIADDFTGASEVAGIGLRYNLEVELFMSKLAITDIYITLFVVSTDTRSLSKEKAVEVAKQTALGIEAIKPDHIYKKVDSVLRGHILDELKVEMEALNLKKALIIAANPSLGRTIKDGQYFINEKPINETGFAFDPEFPIADSKVLEMIKATPGEVQVLKYYDKLPEEGIIIGEASSQKDIEEWANKVDNGWFLAGAGDFFTALIGKGFNAKKQGEASMELPHLYICGTAFKERKEFIKTLSCVSYLPEVVNEDWLRKTGDIIKEKQKVVIAIDETNASALSLRTEMAKAVKEIVERESIKEIFIEGGSTAAAILQELDIKKLTPINELQRGVVRMKVNDLFITVKPGSYQIPDQIRELYLSK